MTSPPRQRFLSLRLRLSPDLEDAAVVALHEAGCLGVQTSPAAAGGRPTRVLLTGWFAGGEAIRPLRARLKRCLRAADVRVGPIPRLVVRREGGWVEAWQRSLRPMKIGRSILVVPEGCRASARGRAVIRMRFGQAFGTVSA